MYAMYEEWNKYNNYNNKRKYNELCIILYHYPFQMEVHLVKTITYSLMFNMVKFTIA